MKTGIKYCHNGTFIINSGASKKIYLSSFLTMYELTATQARKLAVELNRHADNAENTK